MSASSFFDSRAKSTLIAYLQQQHDKCEESLFAAVTAFKESLFARSFLFLHQSDQELNQTFEKALKSMHLERYSSGSNILMQTMIKKNFLFIVRGNIKFEVKLSNENASKQQKGTNAKQFHRRTFAGKEIEQSKVFYSGEAVSPSVYERFQNITEVIASTDAAEEFESPSQKEDTCLEVAVLSNSKYVECFGHLEELRIGFVIQCIIESKLLMNLEENKLFRLASYSSYLEKRQGEYVYRENDVSNEVFIVLKGAFSVSEVSSDEKKGISREQEEDDSFQQKAGKVLKNMIKNINDTFGEEEVKSKIQSRLQNVQCISQQGVLIALPKTAFLNCLREIQSPFLSYGSIDQTIDEQKKQKYLLQNPSNSLLNDSNKILPEKNTFSKHPVNQGSTRAAPINTFTKSNKYLQDMLGARGFSNHGSLKKQDNQDNTVQSTFPAQHFLFNASQSIELNHTQHLQSPSQKNGYLCTDNNKVKSFQSQSIEEYQFGDNGVITPFKLKSGAFRQRKYQSERSLQQNFSSIKNIESQAGEQKQLLSLQPPGINAITAKEEMELKKIGEILPERNSNQKFGQQSLIKLREFVPPQIQNQVLAFPEKKNTLSTQDTKLLQTPQKTIFSPQQKGSLSFFNEQSPTISFKKRCFGTENPKLDAKIGTFFSSEFNNSLESTGQEKDNETIKSFLQKSISPNKGFFSIQNKLNQVQRKKPISQVDSFNRLSSMKHIEECKITNLNQEAQRADSCTNMEEFLSPPPLQQPKKIRKSILTAFSQKDSSEFQQNSNTQSNSEIDQLCNKNSKLPSSSQNILITIPQKKMLIIRKSISSKIPYCIGSDLNSSSTEQNSQKPDSLNHQLQDNCSTIEELNIGQRPYHPQRRVQSKKKITENQQTNEENEEQCLNKSDDSFIMLDNITETMEPPFQAPIVEPIQPKISSKIKPPIPLLDLKSLGESGSQINNYFGHPLSKDAGNSKMKVKDQQNNTITYKGSLGQAKNFEFEQDFLPFKSQERQPLTQSTMWCPSKTLSSFVQTKSQQEVPEIATAKIQSFENEIEHENQHYQMTAHSSKRPSTPAIKKLNLTNLEEQIKKQNTQINQKEEGYCEMKQSRLILPSFDLGGTSQQTKQCISNIPSNDSTPMHNPFEFTSSNSKFSIDKKAPCFESLSFLNPTQNSPQNQSGQSSLTFKKMSSLKQTSMQNINSLYSGLLSSQTYKKRIHQHNNTQKDDQSFTNGESSTIKEIF